MPVIKANGTSPEYIEMGQGDPVVLAVTGITDAMIQYGKATEAVFMHKPKNAKPYGIT